MKHLIDIMQLTPQEIMELIDTACAIMEHPEQYAHKCDGKILATLFFEPSTRTRLSFESAMLSLGGKVLGVASAESSSASKGETVADTVRVVSCYSDIIAMRHPKEGAPLVASMHSEVPVINAGDGMNEHPTQALLDMLTMQQVFGRLEGLKVAIIGDVRHSRVARSNFWGLTTMGAEVKMAAPETLIPKDMQALGVDICSDVSHALRDADVVMGLRMQRERQEAGLVPSYREYSRYFGIDRERMKLAKPNAIVLHPGPLNRGVEMTSEVADGPQSYIREQVTNGVAVRMALLYLLTREGEEK